MRRVVLVGVIAVAGACVVRSAGDDGDGGGEGRDDGEDGGDDGDGGSGDPCVEFCSRGLECEAFPDGLDSLEACVEDCGDARMLDPACRELFDDYVGCFASLSCDELVDGIMNPYLTRCGEAIDLYLACSA